MSAHDEQNKPTVEEAIGDLSGFDEIAILKAFGADFNDLAGTMLLRSLVFSGLRRQGSDDKSAKAEVLGMSLKAINDRFRTETPDIDPDEPDSDAGKDDEPLE